MCTHTQDKIPEKKSKTYMFYPIAKNTETNSNKLTKLVTTCLNYNLAKMEILPIYPDICTV